MSWMMCAWVRSPRKSRAASRLSCSIPDRSKSWPFARRGRWILPAELATKSVGGLIDGTAVAKKIRGRVAEQVKALVARGVVPGLHVVLVGDDPASAAYVMSKGKASAEAGINGQTTRMP